MKRSWPIVRLGELLEQDPDYIETPEARVYPKLSVKLYGKGVTLDAPADGTFLKMKRHQIAKAGQVILSEIWGKKGAIGLVPSEGDGALCTSHFFLFNLLTEKLDPRWLQAVFTANYLEEQLGSEAKGTTGYAAVRPKTLFACKIPLPPLPEQRRIVARIEELNTKIAEARSLRQQTVKEAERLLVCMAHRRDLDMSVKPLQGWRQFQLSGCIRLVDDSRKVEAEESYPNFGIYSFGRGLFHKAPIEGALTSATVLRRVKKDQFIYSRLFAFEGAYGMVSSDFDGHFVSNEYPTFDCDPAHVRIEFVSAYFRSPEVWKDIAVGSKGLGDRRQRVQPSQVLSHNLWVPPIAWQNKIAEAQDKVDALKHLQAETAAELDALLPAVLDKAFKGEL